MNEFFREIGGLLDRFLTPAVKVILVINVISLLVFTILGAVWPSAAQFLTVYLGQAPAMSLLHGFIWEFVTYLFVHANFMHLLGNMLGLWFFGPPLENRWGTARFWRFYLIVGAGAGILDAVVTVTLAPSVASYIPVIGASGAIYGVLLCFAAYYPDMPVYVWGVYPIKAKYLVGIMILLVFLSSASSTPAGGGVSNLTHLSGLGIAYVWMALYHRDWDIRRWRWTRGA